MLKFSPNQIFYSQVLSALPPFLQLKASLVTINYWVARTATIQILTAVGDALRSSPVSLTTQPMVLDSGRHHQPALQTAAALRVSDDYIYDVLLILLLKVI